MRTRMASLHLRGMVLCMTVAVFTRRSVVSEAGGELAARELKPRLPFTQRREHCAFWLPIYPPALTAWVSVVWIEASWHATG